MKVMLLVRSHYDYYLAQLDVSGTNTVQFFAMLRKEYLRLRGFFARYFSVWRFSHCDFYRVRIPIFYS